MIPSRLQLCRESMRNAQRSYELTRIEKHLTPSPRVRSSRRDARLPEEQHCSCRKQAAIRQAKSTRRASIVSRVTYAQRAAKEQRSLQLSRTFSTASGSQSMQKKFIVTGGAGFIGSAVARKLIQYTPHHVLCLTSSPMPEISILVPIASDRRYRFERSDICDGDGFVNPVRLSAGRLLHLAAETHVDRSIDGPAPFIQTNVVGTLTLLEAALSYWRHLPPGRRSASVSIMSRLTKSSVLWATKASFTRIIRISRIHPIRHRKLVRPISPVPGTTPMDYPRSSRIAPTIMGRITSPRNSFPW